MCSFDLTQQKSMCSSSVPCGQFKPAAISMEDISMEVSEDHECVICKKPMTSPKATLGEKGSASINKASKERNESLYCKAG